MRPWIAVAYSAPVAAATAVFIIYPIGQGSFSDGMPLGKVLRLMPNFFNKKEIISDLNGKTPNFDNFIVSQKQENSVPEQILKSQRLPGIYKIHCLQNHFCYFGQTENLSIRIAGHKYRLRNNIHKNQYLQQDFNPMGEKQFQFVVLFSGNEWNDRKTREAKETELIKQNCGYNYNILDSLARPLELNSFFNKIHTQTAKKRIGDSQRNIPKNALGKKIVINNILYPSISEASRQTGHCRRLIRERINSEDYPTWYSSDI